MGRIGGHGVSWSVMFRLGIWCAAAVAAAACTWLLLRRETEPAAGPRSGAEGAAGADRGVGAHAGVARGGGTDVGTSPSERRTGRLALRVVDEDARPVPDVRAAVLCFLDPTGWRRRIEGVTDAGGSIRFDAVPAGPVRILAGGASRYWDLAADGDDVVTIAVAAHRSKSTMRASVDRPEGTGSLRGKVRDSSGSPVGGAWVGCRAVSGAQRSGCDEPGGAPVWETVSKSDGSFSLEGLPEGTCDVEAWAERRAPATMRVETADDASRILVFTLGPGATLTGSVRDRSGRPLPRAIVSARAEGAVGRGIEVATDASGRFRLEHVPAALVTASAGYLAGNRVRAAIDLRTAGTVAWDPVLDTGRVLSGTVTDESGRPRRHARVRAVIDSAHRSWIGETIADDRGCFEIANAPEGMAMLSVDVARWEEGGTWRLGPDSFPDPIAVAIPEAARPTAWITGRIVDADGAVLAGAALSASRAPVGAVPDLSVRSRAIDGSFRIGPLAPGDYVVDAEAPSGALVPVVACTLGPAEEMDVGELRCPREGFVKVLLDDGCRDRTLDVVDRWGRRTLRLRPVAGFAASGPLAPGAYTLARGRAPGDPAGVACEVREGETTTVRLGPERPR